MNPLQTFRRLVAPAALLFTVGAVPGFAAAQQPQTAPDAARGRHARHGQRLEHRLAMMTQRLGLSADQQARIRQILTQHHQRRQAMRQQPGERTPEQRRAAMVARFEMQDQIAAVLNAQQRQQMVQMHRERMLERMEHGGHGGRRGRGHHRGRGGRRGLPPGAV